MSNLPVLYFDARHLKSGIGSYITGILSFLHTKPSLPFTLKLIGDENVLKKMYPQFDAVNERSSLYSLSSQITIPAITGSKSCLHYPHYNAPLFHNGKLIVTIYDMAHLALPSIFKNPLGRFYSVFMLNNIRKKANTVLTISHFSKLEIIKYAKIPADKIKVIYCGVNPVFRKPNDPKATKAILSQLGLNVPFILYVGNLKPHKNLPILIQAFKDVKRQHNLPHVLVLAGSPDKAFYRTVTIDDTIRVFPDCKLNTLVGLYQGCDLHVLLSLYEGFGIPPLEAMACRKPSLVSDIPIFHEILGDSAVYADPNNVRDIAEKIKKILTDENMRDHYGHVGYSHQSLYDWSITGAQTLDIYQEALM